VISNDSVVRPRNPVLTSAVTLAHWALQKRARAQLKLGLLLTIGLGIVFLCRQLFEHFHVWTALHLRLDSGAYGATFFMLTGFHGLHVAIGATILIVIFARSLHGDFSAQDQFALQALLVLAVRGRDLAAAARARVLALKRRPL
jgi:cytochrome c oxidase subunit 3